MILSVNLQKTDCMQIAMAARFIILVEATSLQVTCQQFDIVFFLIKIVCSAESRPACILANGPAAIRGSRDCLAPLCLGTQEGDVILTRPSQRRSPC